MRLSQSKSLVALLPLRTLLIIISIIVVINARAQDHPNLIKIDSLRNHLHTTQGIERINCLNALAEEFWWWQLYSGLSDSVSMWATEANKESKKQNYLLGYATSLMHFGVVDLFRKNLTTSEKYFRQALPELERLNMDKETGWCNAWLAQNLFWQMKFNESLSLFNKSLSFFEKTSDREGKGKTWAWLASLYATVGDYERGIFYAGKSLSMREQMSDHICVARSLSSIANFYRIVGANDEAMNYYRKTLDYVDEHSLDYRAAERNFLLESLGSFYRILNKPDSSLYFFQQVLQIDPGYQMAMIGIGETLLHTKQYDSALQIFLKPIEHFRTGNDKWDLMRVLLDAAKAYLGKGNNKKALDYGHESLAIASTAGVRSSLIDNYALLSTLHSNLSQTDSAYYYLKLATTLKNDLTKDQFLFRLSDYKTQTEYNAQQDSIASLANNNKILDQANKSKEEKLKQASLLKWVFAVASLIALLAAIFIYRSLTLKRKNEHLENQKAQSDLKLKASELEMQALRAQMNPHFIFNCLSSINHFILKNETDFASDYLTKFSRLIRIVLINSKNKLITLEDELEMLRLYLDMERLRFKNSFHYNINFINSIDIDNIYIPPLLLQPFAENAIWHGLMNKEGEGHLEISLRTENDFLICHMIDDGIGRKAAAEIRISDEKKKSLGLKITRERFDLLNETDEKKTFFEFEDLYDEHGNAAGTKVMLKIRIREAAYSLT